MKVKDILDATGGRLLSGDPSAEIAPARISTDSRAVRRGDFFVALRGDKFNGDDFVEDAFRKGASGAMVRRLASPVDAGRIVISVKDTTKAVQDIAAFHRSGFKIPIIAVTGSNGKTTTKEMIWRILSSGYNVLKNDGTKNNHIGVPQTLLKLNGQHDISVLEFGMNHQGEIRRLGRIARPSVAVITNIGPSHLEHLGDLPGVFKAKREIFEFMDGKDPLAVLNGDDAYLSRVKSRKMRIVRFGFKKANELRAGKISEGDGIIKFTVNGNMDFTLNAFGVHNVYNALAAVAVGLHFGLGYRIIQKRLYGHRSCGMRLSLETVEGLKILNDCYNSNPSSMRSALQALRDISAGSRWVVSGDMLELGRKAGAFHRAVGRQAAAFGADGLIAFGPLSASSLSEAKLSGMKGQRLWQCSDHGEAAAILRKVARRGDAVLIKGSRAMKMEEIITKLKTQNSKLKT